MTRQKNKTPTNKLDAEMCASIGHLTIRKRSWKRTTKQKTPWIGFRSCWIYLKKKVKKEKLRKNYGTIIKINEL